MQLNVLDKTLAVKNFFSAYAHNINGELNSMTPAEIREHLDSEANVVYVDLYAA